MFLIDLWLPILLCGIALFFASFLAWVILPHHFSDYKKVNDEGGLMDFYPQNGIAAGELHVPAGKFQAGDESARIRGTLQKWSARNSEYLRDAQHAIQSRHDISIFPGDLSRHWIHHPDCLPQWNGIHESVSSCRNDRNPGSRFIRDIEWHLVSKTSDD